MQGGLCWLGPGPLSPDALRRPGRALEAVVDSDPARVSWAGRAPGADGAAWRGCVRVSAMPAASLSGGPSVTCGKPPPSGLSCQVSMASGLSWGAADALGSEMLLSDSIPVCGQSDGRLSPRAGAESPVTRMLGISSLSYSHVAACS